MEDPKDEDRSIETMMKTKDGQKLVSMAFQLIDHLDLVFVPCTGCKGTGEGKTWIPTCQTCYGLGRKLKVRDVPKQTGPVKLD